MIRFSIDPIIVWLTRALSCWRRGFRLTETLLKTDKVTLVLERERWKIPSKNNVKGSKQDVFAGDRLRLEVVSGQSGRGAAGPQR
jgi:hypothetical protein